MDLRGSSARSTVLRVYIPLGETCTDRRLVSTFAPFLHPFYVYGIGTVIDKTVVLAGTASCRTLLLAQPRLVCAFPRPSLSRDTYNQS